MMNEIQYKELLENFLHEVNSLNTIIKSSAEILSKATKKKIDNKTLKHHASIILENSFILSTQFDIVNYQLNPDFITIEKPDLRNLFGKFYKSSLSFKRMAKQKNIKINLSGKTHTLINTYPVIDTLPILIIENAIKYSLKDSDINIYFTEDENSIEIVAENIGPKLSKEEINKVFEKGFRGDNAIDTGELGYGFGLNFVKQICEIHNATCKVFSEENEFQVDGICYSNFKLVLDSPKRLIYK